MSADYNEWLSSKVEKAEYYGFELDRKKLHRKLFRHQPDVVQWAIKGGRRAIFASFGLGKTIMQCEILRQLHIREGGKYLIICPLGVKHEFQQSGGPMVGIDIKYVRTQAEVDSCDNPFMITNYERVRDGDIDVNYFTGVTLDEASVLRSYGSKTYQLFLEMFKNVSYRFVATATPSPNKFKELIHYAGYLGVMDTGQALTRFFQRDSKKANNLTLYPHEEKNFWLWVSSWAVFIDKPSDLGYSNEGYDLPKMTVKKHVVKVDHSTAGFDRWGQGKLLRDAAISLQDAAAEKRETIEDRLAMAKKIMSEKPDAHWLIWHHLEDERHAIKKAIPEAQCVWGSQNLEKREEIISGFTDGKVKILATKPEIAGSGCNFQKHCADAIFLGINYKFNDTIQAIHRIYRFLQTKNVNIHFIVAESEEVIWEVFNKKWKQHNKLVESMRKIVRENGLTDFAIHGNLKRSMGVDRKEVKSKHFTCVHNDTVYESGKIDDNSIDLIHTSIPFSNHYEYSASFHDMGYNKDDGRFFEQLDFTMPDWLRILKPGRIAAIHVKDRVLYGNVTKKGFPTVNRFSDKTADRMEAHGFHFVGRITVVTDVVSENNQTYRLGWTENSKDSSKMGCGMSEYILLFRKLPSDTSNAYADTPVTKSKDEYTRARWQIDAHGFWRSSGDRLMHPDELSGWDLDRVKQWWEKYNKQHVYDFGSHINLGKGLEEKGRLPAQFMLFAPVSNDENVWHDVARMRTLNGEQSRKKLAYHVCPLQLDIVQRIIERFSNKGELIYDPFGGLMTVPYMAVKLGRRGYGVELNESYWRDGVNYCRAAEVQMSMPTLFDHLEESIARVDAA